MGTLVDVAGAGFDSSSTVTIQFDGSTVATETSTPNGGFETTILVPFSSSIGDKTVKATHRSISKMKTGMRKELLNSIQRTGDEGNTRRKF